jgi:integrase
VTERIISTYIRPTFEDKRVADLKKNSIKAWFSALATTPARKRTKLGKPQEFRAAPTTEDQNRARRATANRTLSVLKAVLNYAAENDMIVARGPWVDVKPHKVADKPIERFLSTDEVTRLLNASPPDLRRLARGALLTGARYGELTDLRVADVTIEPNAGRVYLRETKNGIPRHVPLSPEGIAFFTEIITGKVGIDFVFVKANGTPWARNHAVRPLALACTAGNISPAISFHMLRHSYASLLAQAGADLLTISKLLGHKDTRITERHYAHLCERTLSNAVTNLLPNFGFKPDPKVVSITAGAK